MGDHRRGVVEQKRKNSLRMVEYDDKYNKMINRSDSKKDSDNQILARAQKVIENTMQRESELLTFANDRSRQASTATAETSHRYGLKTSAGSCSGSSITPLKGRKDSMPSFTLEEMARFHSLKTATARQKSITGDAKPKRKQSIKSDRANTDTVSNVPIDVTKKPSDTVTNLPIDLIHKHSRKRLSTADMSNRNLSQSEFIKSVIGGKINYQGGLLESRPPPVRPRMIPSSIAEGSVAPTPKQLFESAISMQSAMKSSFGSLSNPQEINTITGTQIIIEEPCQSKHSTTKAK